MIGVLVHEALQRLAVEELLVVGAQMQDHLGAAVGLVVRPDLVAALAVRVPAHALGIGALGEHRHLLGDDEGGVEADTELSNN